MSLLGAAIVELSRLRQGLAARAGWIFIGNAVAAACGLVSLPLLLRLYPQGEFSTYASTLAIQQFCMGVAYTSVGVGAANALGRSQERSLIATLIRVEFESAMAASLVAAALMWASWALIAVDQPIVPYLLCASSGILFRINGVTSAAYRAQGRERRLGVALITQAMLRLLAIVPLALLKVPMWMLLAAGTSVDLVTVSYHRLRLAGRFIPSREIELPEREYRRSARGMFVVAVMDGAMNSLDRLVVAAVIGQGAVGVYHVIRRYAAVLGLVADPLYQVFLTRFARMNANGRGSEIVPESLRFAATLGPIVVMGGCVVWLTDWFWRPLLLPGFEPADLQAFYTVFGGYAVATCFIAVHPALMSLGYWSSTVWITATANITFVALAIFLGGKLGLIGIALAICLQFFVSIGSKLIICLARSGASS